MLAAELLYISLMPLSPAMIGIDRKFEIITTVLSWAERPVQVTEELAVAASPGYIKGGQAFLNYRWALEGQLASDQIHVGQEHLAAGELRVVEPDVAADDLGTAEHQRVG
ncbi:hypothetical protein [Sphaerisporangium perillae]|uniref:hypothetical protein n=1 Tax=Sphaerisporangium perillae TaxID=2935860 RepID=UPI00200E99FF|nr:hypothetical protein [Sphaerisporangium perillae]